MRVTKREIRTDFQNITRKNNRNTSKYFKYIEFFKSKINLFWTRAFLTHLKIVSFNLVNRSQYFFTVTCFNTFYSTMILLRQVGREAKAMK